MERDTQHKLNKQERRQKILRDISNLIDKQLILELREQEIHVLVGIKNTLISSLKVSGSQESTVELIKSRHSHIRYKILELDRLRLKHIVAPRSQNSSFSWDSASTEVSYESALGLFEADLQYLLSRDLSDRLPVGSADARDQVLDWIGASHLHCRFGKGSKVSLEQYGRLIEVTQVGWVDHLVELGVLAPKEPVYELGQPSWVPQADGLGDYEDNLCFEDVTHPFV